MNQIKIENSVKAALIADSYLLGSHWIYEEAKLEKLDIDWEELNAPCSPWHKGKEKGDFTHYGDHALWLDTFVKENHSFNIDSYRTMWLEKMQDYKGYVDGACRETLEVLEKDNSATRCAKSGDLSIIGRIAPLLYVSKTKSEFLSHVKSFVSFTHNNEKVLKTAALFASILYDVIEGSSITDAIESVNVDPTLQEAFNEAKLSKDKPTLETIYKFGPACSVDGGFEGTIHLLMKYDNFKEAMIANAKSGGDSSARGMIVGMIMGASDYTIPPSWEKGTRGLNVN